MLNHLNAQERTLNHMKRVLNQAGWDFVEEVGEPGEAGMVAKPSGGS